MSGGNVNPRFFSYNFTPSINYKSIRLQYYPISIHNPANTTTYIELVHTSEAQCTLGVILSPDVNSAPKMKHSNLLKAQAFFSQIQNLLLSLLAKWIAVQTVLSTQ
jgi:hypothetical protein